MDGPPGWELVEAPLQEVGSWRDLPDGPPGWELVDAPFQKVGSWRDLPDDVLARVMQYAALPGQRWAMRRVCKGWNASVCRCDARVAMAASESVQVCADTNLAQATQLVQRLLAGPAAAAHLTCHIVACKGLSLALVRHTMAAIGPLLAASDLRSLTLATWLYDVTLLQHVPSSLESLTMDGVHPRINVDAGKWGATVAVLRGLRRLEVGWMDDYMVPALSALTGLTSLHLGLRTGPLLLPSVLLATAIQHLTALVELHLSIEGQLQSENQWGFSANLPVALPRPPPAPPVVPTRIQDLSLRGLYCKMDLVIDLLKRCPELRRAALPHDQPGDTYELPFGATLARCTQLATLRLFTNGSQRLAPTAGQRVTMQQLGGLSELRHLELEGGPGHELRRLPAMPSLRGLSLKVSGSVGDACAAISRQGGLTQLLIHTFAAPSAEAHAAILDALSGKSGLRDLDLTCCAIFTRANAPEPVVSLPALRSLQLVTIPSRGLTSAEARQEEAARRAGICWLRTLSGGGALTRLTLAGLAHDVPLVSEWDHQLSMLRELEYQPRTEVMPKGEPMPSISPLPYLARLSIVDTDSIVPAVYPRLRVLTWHRKAELRAPDLAAALTAHPKLTQLDFRWSTWLRGHLSCLEPLSDLRVLRLAGHAASVPGFDINTLPALPRLGHLSLVEVSVGVTEVTQLPGRLPSLYLLEFHRCMLLGSEAELAASLPGHITVRASHIASAEREFCTAA